MHFRNLKLTKNELESLVRAKPEHVKPDTLLPGPLYLFLKRNEKAVAFRGPLHWLSTDEHQQISSLLNTGQCYFPKCIEKLNSLNGLATRLRTQISASEGLVDPEHRIAALKDKMWQEYFVEKSSKISLDLSTIFSYGLLDEDANRELQVDPFFIIYLVHLCLQPLISVDLKDQIKKLQEESVESYERALYISSHLIFFSMMMGGYRLPTLERLFSLSFFSSFSLNPLKGVDPIYVEFFNWLVERYAKHPWSPIQTQELSRRNERCLQFLLSRIQFMRRRSRGIQDEIYSVSGEGGFA